MNTFFLFFISLTSQQTILQNSNIIDIASPFLINQLSSNPQLLRTFIEYAIPGDQTANENLFRLPFQNKELIINSTRNRTKDTVQQCSCSTILNPVCGNDEKTYLNECTAICNNKQILYYSACVEDLDQNLQQNLNDPQFDFNPNNDSDRFINPDDLSYTLYYPVNPYYATLKCKNCPKEKQEVCASNLKTYKNRCEAECRGLRIKSFNACNQFYK